MMALINNLWQGMLLSLFIARPKTRFHFGLFNVAMMIIFIILLQIAGDYFLTASPKTFSDYNIPDYGFYLSFYLLTFFLIAVAQRDSTTHRFVLVSLAAWVSPSLVSFVVKYRLIHSAPHIDLYEWATVFVWIEYMWKAAILYVVARRYFGHTNASTKIIILFVPFLFAGLNYYFYYLGFWYHQEPKAVSQGPILCNVC